MDARGWLRPPTVVGAGSAPLLRVELCGEASRTGSVTDRNPGRAFDSSLKRYRRDNLDQRRRARDLSG